MKNQVQLITYVDRLGGGGLKELRALLTVQGASVGALSGLFGAVHLLPFFHPIDGADAGFDPIEHTLVDPRLGAWPDVHDLTQDLEVMADVIVNHISSHSPQFRDVIQKGAASPHSGLFLGLDDVFPNGAREADLLAIYRPRPGLPFTMVQLANGERRVLWTTFTPSQLDIAVRHPQGRAYLQGILKTFADHGIGVVRLDAVGYAIKQAGSSCFMLPETFGFIAEFAAQARSLGIEVLVEIHAHYQRQIDIARQVDWVYDFALPPLVLHALFFNTAAPLKAWLRIRPNNTLTVLDTHDGIGIIDIGAESTDRSGRPGLVPPAELDALVERIHSNSAGASRAATGAAASNLDLYQVNCTFYDALGRNDAAYLLARAIQFFMPGVPQVYYVGLLAGENDTALLQRTGVGRDINRHRYSIPEIAAALQRPVVQKLVALIRLRNEHPAFQGQFSVQETATEQTLVLRWQQAGHQAELHADLQAGTGLVLLISDGVTQSLSLQT